MSVTREQYNPTHKIYMHSFSRFCFLSFDLSVAVHFFSSFSLNNLSKIEKDDDISASGRDYNIHIALDNDILLVGRSVFTKQHHGYFEESFVLIDDDIIALVDKKKPQLSGRHVLGLISSLNDTVAVLNLDDCLPTPTVASICIQYK